MTANISFAGSCAVMTGTKSKRQLGAGIPPKKREADDAQKERKHLSLQRVERIAQTGLRHHDNPKTSKSSIIRIPKRRNGAWRHRQGAADLR